MEVCSSQRGTAVRPAFAVCRRHLPPPTRSRLPARKRHRRRFRLKSPGRSPQWPRRCTGRLRTVDTTPRRCRNLRQSVSFRRGTGLGVCNTRSGKSSNCSCRCPGKFQRRTAGCCHMQRTCCRSRRRLLPWYRGYRCPLCRSSRCTWQRCRATSLQGMPTGNRTTGTQAPSPTL
jgi:hypothetical protein